MSAFLNCNTRECKLPNRRDLSAGEDIDMTAFLSAYEFSPLPNSEGAMRAHDNHPQARNGFDVGNLLLLIYTMASKLTMMQSAHEIVPARGRTLMSLTLVSSV